MGSEKLKKPTEKLTEKNRKDPPGCPPGPPPNILQFRELDSDGEDDIPIKESQKKLKSKKEDERQAPKVADDSSKLNTLQQRMFKISGQNLESFMREIENVQQNTKSEDSKENSDKDSHKCSGDDENNDEDDEDIEDIYVDESENSENSDDDEQNKLTAIKIADTNEINISIPLPPIPPPPPPAMGMPSGPPPPPIGMPRAMMFRPPPLRPSGSAIPGITMRMPPGPPPSRPGPQMQHRMGLRMPPGPPPGLPPNRSGIHHNNQKGHHHNHLVKDSKGISIITAKPQIRNLSADVTRFVPSALRVKREDQKFQSAKKPKLYHQEVWPTESKKGATKDDAYMQFMREMQGLL